MRKILLALASTAVLAAPLWPNLNQTPANSPKAGPCRPGQNQGRGPQPLPGDGNGLLPHRRMRPAPGRLRGPGPRQRLDQKRLTDYGLANANVEAWGDFGRGWDIDKSLRGPGRALLPRHDWRAQSLDALYPRPAAQAVAYVNVTHGG
ncbi:MAG: hypothetical protein WKG07_36425 [Hymenobacter sp.]